MFGMGTGQMRNQAVIDLINLTLNLDTQVRLMAITLQSQIWV